MHCMNFSATSINADTIKPNNSSPPRLSFSFEQTPQPAAQRSNRFTIPETRSVLRPISFNYNSPNSNDRNIFRNFESSLQRENTLPVVQLFQQDKPLRQQEEKERQNQNTKTNKNIFVNDAQKTDYRNEQRDPKRISQVRGSNDAFTSGFKVFSPNGNFRIIVDETSTTLRPAQFDDIRNSNTQTSIKKIQSFSLRDDTFYQPSKTEYVTKVPQLSLDYARNFNETIKQRLNSALVGTALRGPTDSEQESSTPRSKTFDIKPSDILFNNAERKETTADVNRGVRPTAAYLVESEKKGEYYLYSSESPNKPSFTSKNPFEISTEEVVIVRQTKNHEENYRQSLPSTNVYTRTTTPSNSGIFEDHKKTASINQFSHPSTPTPNIENSNNYKFSNQFKKPTIQLPKQNGDVKPWMFNVANKQVTAEDVNRQHISEGKFSTLSQVKSTIPSTIRQTTTPYTPYNYIKQMTKLNNNEIKSSTYRQQIRSTTAIPTSSRDIKEQQIRENQVKVTADRARVLEQNLQRNSLTKTSDVNRYIEPTTMRFTTESTRFRLSRPTEIIRDNFVDSVGYSNDTVDDSDEYYYDDLEEYEDDLPISKPNPPPSSPLPTKPPTTTSTTTTTVRAKPEPVRTQAPPRSDDKCIGSECNEKPLVRYDIICTHLLMFCLKISTHNVPT